MPPCLINFQKPTLIDTVFDPLGDGQCGWRSIALCLGHGEAYFKQIKLAMMSTLLDWYEDETDNGYLIASIGGEEYFRKILQKLLIVDGRINNDEYWFADGECALVADTYNKPVIHLCPETSNYIPLMYLPSTNRTGRPITWMPIIMSLDVDKNHYLAVILQPSITADLIRWPRFGMALTNYGKECFNQLMDLGANLSKPLPRKEKE